MPGIRASTSRQPSSRSASQERLAVGKNLHRIAILVEQIARCLADSEVIVDDEDRATLSDYPEPEPSAARSRDAEGRALVRSC